MIKNDRWIREQGSKMIFPFTESLIIEISNDTPFDFIKAISFGTSSYGYDLRLSEKDFRIFKHIPGKIVDPKNFDSDHLEVVQPQQDHTGIFFVIPGHGYALGVSRERFTLPRNITVLSTGKSTYARTGVIVNTTPFEAGWCGHPTLEISNSSPSDVKIYANEGICQCIFFEGEPCEVSYADRDGKYQNQPESVIVAKT